MIRNGGNFGKERCENKMKSKQEIIQDKNFCREYLNTQVRRLVNLTKNKEFNVSEAKECSDRISYCISTISFINGVLDD